MKKAIALIGPTAVGKTALSIKIAKYLNTEIISGDSVQVYRSLDIGSAKVTKEEMDGVKHHLIDILDPTDSYSVADFQTKARLIIDNLSSNNKIPLICGGTGLYIKACLYDYDFTETSRTNEFDYMTNEELYSKLVELNDKEIPDINNRKRLLRHMEIYSSGNHVEIKKNEPVYDYLIIGLTMDRDKLYERINNRVDKMIEDGLINEVKSLYDKGIRTNSVNSIGYKELYDYFDGLTTLEEAINLIKQHSRNLAKRQFTWFRNQMEVSWVDCLNSDYENQVFDLINNFIKKGSED